MSEEKTKNVEEEKQMEEIAEAKKEDKIEEKKTEDKPAKKERIKELKIKKEEAVARGNNIHMSMKQGTYICRFIKNKKIDQAIKELEQVIKLKKAVPFRGEIPHRKGKGMMSGRYPVKASGFVIKVLKSLRGNVLINGMDLDKTIIVSASTSWASRPAKSGGRESKRSHLILKAKEVEVKK